jgi:dCMP deaminase
MSRPDWKEYYLGIAKAVAQRSTCLRRRYGSVIVKDNRIVSTGYNGSPRGALNCVDTGKCIRQEQNVPHGERYELCCSVHSEMNAIMNADPKDLVGSTLYLYGDEEIKDKDWFVPMTKTVTIKAKPCMMCERLIINARIKEVVSESV